MDDGKAAQHRETLASRQSFIEKPMSIVYCLMSTDYRLRTSVHHCIMTCNGRPKTCPDPSNAVTKYAPAGRDNVADERPLTACCMT